MTQTLEAARVAPEPAGFRCESTSSHAAQIFREGMYPAARIAEHLAEALASDQGALVFATRAHLDEVQEQLTRLGTDVEATMAVGQLIFGDAAALANALVSNDEPRPSAFEEHVASVCRASVLRFGRCRVYGEIVDVLAQRGDTRSALQLERWWNHLLAEQPMDLMCGYALESFREASSVGTFRSVCDAHGEVTPAANDAPGEGRLAAELQQALSALDTEARHRHELESSRVELNAVADGARHLARSVTDHLASLQRFTSALLEASLLSDILDVTRAELEDRFGAEHVVLALPSQEAPGFMAVRSALPREGENGVTGLLLASAARLLEGAGAAPIWLSSDAELAREVPGLIELMPVARRVAILPLHGRGGCGALILVQRTSRELEDDGHALLGDYTRQLALALDRARSYEMAERARNRLQLLADAANRIARAKLDLKQVAETIVYEVTRAGFAQSCAINLRERAGPTLPLLALHHVDPETNALLQRILQEQPVELGRGVVGGVASSGKPARVVSLAELSSRTTAEYRPHLREYPVSSVLVVPLLASGEVIGTLTASRVSPELPFTEEDQQLLQDLGDRAALSVENAMLYQQAQEERRRAESASRSKDEFLAMLGHELRNPLAPIVTALQLLALKGDAAPTSEHALIERQVKHLTHLVDDLLDVSRVTRGKIALAKAPVEMFDVIAKALETASPLFEQRRHYLVLEVPRQGVRVDGDELRLAQVFANLLTNAAKYTEPGGRIRLTATKEGEHVEVRVRDNGTGIDPELLPHVFEMFIQGHRASDRADGGLGLGLALVRNLVELHGGTVEALSDGPGQGTELVVRLPALEAGFTLVPASILEPFAIVSKEQVRRILVVDDNEDAADILAEALRVYGHVVEVVHDPVTALDRCRTFAPEIAILDIGLPVMDGYELALRLRESRPQPRLFAVTGYGQEADRARARAHGFEAHFVKPVELARIVRAVAEVEADKSPSDGAGPSTT